LMGATRIEPVALPLSTAVENCTSVALENCTLSRLELD
jgi:hypothetical protein